MNKVKKIAAWLSRRPINLKTCHNAAKVGRNEPCPCLSGMKHKACCWGKFNVDMNTQLSQEIAQKDARYYGKRYKEKTENE